MSEILALTGLLLATETARLRRLQQAVPQKTLLLGELAPRLCDRNRLVRLTTIHQLAQLGQESASLKPRVTAILTAYLKALCSDAVLRRAAATEVKACLDELGILAPGTPLPVAMNDNGDKGASRSVATRVSCP